MIYQLFSLLISRIKESLKAFDWILFGSALLLSIAGLVTMYSFSDGAVFFEKQILWLTVSVGICFFFTFLDLRFLRRSGVVVALYFAIVGVLVLLFVLGVTVQGSERWFSFGGFSVQPSEPAKLVLIILLAKYFTRRHIEIAHVRHIIVSGAYAFILFALVFLQPDLGSALILFFIWFGMVIVAGISKKHLAIILMTGIVAFSGMWMFVLQDYQKDRITSFLHPLTDIEGAGYNAYQSMVAVGSGELLGKGIGYGTQSKLNFLPEYQTDFIFASFAEEWGFIGVIFLFMLYGIVLWRLLQSGLRGASNFEVLFSIGVAIYLMTHVTIHVGMNVGLLPITGTTIPFMSYGGTHLVTEFSAIGMVMAMRKYRRKVIKRDTESEVVEI